MSLTSKLVFAGSCVFAISTISYVMYKQQYDSKQLHEGVILDLERQQLRKTENLFRVQQQAALTKKLRQIEEEKQRETAFR